MIKHHCHAVPRRIGLPPRARSLTVLAAFGFAALGACGGDPDADEITDTLAEQPAAVPEPPARSLPERPGVPGVPGGPTPNGLSIPEDLRDWQVIGVADRTNSGGTLRVLIGNDKAVIAARYGQTHPWPDGSMISHLVWTSSEDPVANTVTPGDFSALTLMVKNSAAYVADGGWAYGTWSGPELVPPTAADFDRACVDCHTENVKDDDYVFTRPGRLPTDSAIAEASSMPRGLLLPADFREWGVIGAASRGDDQTVRVTVGNSVALDAVRAGKTNPWPDRSMLADYVWAATDNPKAPDTVTPGAFISLNLMQRRGASYPDDGGWVYGIWWGTQLAAPTDPQFDRTCVGCHTGRVATQDYVFTQPGPLPLTF